MNHYLYILPFSDKKNFKIGISSNNLDRVIKHDNTYNIDLDSVVIIKGSKTKVSALERTLLSLFPYKQDDKFLGKDGYTEIRAVKYLDDCLSHTDTLITLMKLKKSDFESERPKEIIKESPIKLNINQSPTANQVIDKLFANIYKLTKHKSLTDMYIEDEGYAFEFNADIRGNGFVFSDFTGIYETGEGCYSCTSVKAQGSKGDNPTSKVQIYFNNLNELPNKLKSKIQIEINLLSYSINQDLKNINLWKN